MAGQHDDGSAANRCFCTLLFGMICNPKVSSKGKRRCYTLDCYKATSAQLQQTSEPPFTWTKSTRSDEKGEPIVSAVRIAVGLCHLVTYTCVYLCEAAQRTSEGIARICAIDEPPRPTRCKRRSLLNPVTMFWAAQSTIEETFNAYTDASLSPRRSSPPSQAENEKEKSTARFMSDPKVATLGSVTKQETAKPKTSTQPPVKKGPVTRK